MEELWNTVCEERQTGEFIKRAPKKKNAKINIVTNLVNAVESESTNVS